MKQLALLSLCLIMIAIAGASALLAIQNVSPVSITVFRFQSIQMPLGLALTACAALGAVLTAVSLSFNQSRDRQY